MDRHAYLIMAHDNFDLLKILLSRLDDARNDIYLHIDSKAGAMDESAFSSILKESGLYFTERTDVHWGGYSQIRCELILLRASAPRHYSYYHLISGSDLPLKSQDEIHAFFEEHAGREFIAFDGEVSKPARERVSLYHYFRESSSPMAEPADRLLTLIQRLFHVDRLKSTSIELRKGPNWFSITDALAQYVLENESWIDEHFSRSVCADELFLQTLAAASPFSANMYDDYIDGYSMANLRYVDWERGDGDSPYTFQDEDRAMLLNLPHLFARKFDHAVI